MQRIGIATSAATLFSCGWVRLLIAGGVIITLILFGMSQVRTTLNDTRHTVAERSMIIQNQDF